jgi:hypothetical protein
MKKMVRKYGRTLVKETLEEVAAEERVKYMHDVLGCKECYTDPYSGHMSYCPRSVYNPFHPSHVCLLGDECLCHRSNFAVEYL